MRKLYFLLLSLLFVTPIFAEESEKSKINVGFYGFVRTDFYYNSRATASAINDLFTLYPLDVELDALGEDLNATSSSGFISVASRLGVDVSGGRVGSALASAKIEADFAGFSTSTYVLRIRHAYFNLKWESGSSLLMGQTWHPMFGTVFPRMANLSTGAPFQPFSRAPQVRYSYRTGGWNIFASAIYQLQNCSAGVDGFTNQYQRNGCTPEIYLGLDHYSERWQFGGGVNMLSISPRTQSEYNGSTYKVSERMTALSGEVHAQYKSDKLFVAMKSIYASSTESNNMISGYGVTSISTKTGAREYTPLHSSSTWLNIEYGEKWKPYLFLGYTKSLGSGEALLSEDLIYGRGIGIDQMTGANIGLSYNLSAFSVNLEYSNTTAWYGDIDLATGRVESTHTVANNRVVTTFIYRF